MSFILDALKKAEAERSRNLGPVLMDVRIAPARQRLPTWAWVLGVVLLANMLVLGWLLLRRPAAAPVTPAVTAASVAPAAPAVAQPIAPVVVQPAPAVVEQPISQPAATLVAPVPAQGGAVVTAIPQTTVIEQPPLNVDNLPTMQDMLASGVTLPPLQLSLHVYDDAPAGRYVLLNSKRMREGDELPEGIRVERITPRGVVLDVRGRRFLLVAGG